ncbi:lanthionine synthetase C family protein [Actinomadura chibensis]|uniref:Lanthionine synthetase C family protein n=1 Tax=Actinomadura chibensis TaxID=392828 RepID=A0A5D0NTX4_9ACTN|nr:lanthionine synthetase C family protein [Actinomadura chibensis]TYB47817.1 lanthionine synthetase C family protein [Actinomadura chibensis]
MSTEQNLAEGAVGIALLHLETGAWEAAYTALQEAVSSGVSTAAGASLFYGAPALAFVLASSNRADLTRAKAIVATGTATVTRRRLEAAHRRIDRRRRPAYAEFDLIRGLTGLGVALRRIGALDLLREVLTYLVRLTEPLDGLPGWWCPTGPNRSKPGPAGGHSNHGMAHGITGPLALMALTMNDGIHVNGQPAALARICQWLDRWERHTDSGQAWWPQIITLDELRRGDTDQQSPLRPSWCYGTPGIARAQQLTARALGDTARQRKAETAFAACVSDPGQLARLTCRGLCHGTAGLLAAGRRIAADALTPIPVAPLLDLHRQAAAPDEPPGFLDGTAGAQLTATGITTSWDACLLLC